MQKKQIIAYKYNEFMNEEVAVPIQFNLFNNADEFYFKVGTGSLSTVAALNFEQLLKLGTKIFKIQKWKEQCRDKKINVRKKAGQFGGITLVFISKDNGRNIYVWMTAKGKIAKGRVIDEQTVRLNPLNISAIYCHIGRIKELYDAREEERQNAKLLK
jgi:hypothetical protein